MVDDGLTSQLRCCRPSPQLKPQLRSFARKTPLEFSTFAAAVSEHAHSVYYLRFVSTECTVSMLLLKLHVRSSLQNVCSKLKKVTQPSPAEDVEEPYPACS